MQQDHLEAKHLLSYELISVTTQDIPSAFAVCLCERKDTNSFERMHVGYFSWTEKLLFLGSRVKTLTLKCGHYVPWLDECPQLEQVELPYTTFLRCDQVYPHVKGVHVGIDPGLYKEVSSSYFPNATILYTNLDHFHFFCSKPWWITYRGHINQTCYRKK